VKYQDDNRERRITQLRKGILELAVMGALYNQTHYGYSLIRVLCENGSIDLKEGTIYPILGRLSRDGLVSSQWVESDQGPPRKYYHLTPAGRRLFDDLRQEFQVLVALVQQPPKTESQPRPGKKLFVGRS
jgi:PadR family transcriptional regulator PadR